MKLKVFRSISKNGKPYWSISAHNSKNKEDKGTYYVSFGKDCYEPMPQKGTTQSGKEYEYADIDVLDMTFGWFNGSPSLWINKCTQKGESVNVEVPTRKNQQMTINPDDLPF